MTTQTRRLNAGLYEFTIRGVRYEVERGLAAVGYGLNGTRPTWDLFAIVDGKREWINDFDSKRDAVEHASCI